VNELSANAGSIELSSKEGQYKAPLIMASGNFGGPCPPEGHGYHDTLSLFLHLKQIN
jgi:phosphatidylethanolamine-binding protein (PEBP) family uncharacterized protein